MTRRRRHDLAWISFCFFMTGIICVLLMPLTGPGILLPGAVFILIAGATGITGWNHVPAQVSVYGLGVLLLWSVIVYAVKTHQQAEAKAEMKAWAAAHAVDPSH